MKCIRLLAILLALALASCHARVCLDMIVEEDGSRMGDRPTATGAP